MSLSSLVYPPQVSGVWGNWYQGYGRDGYPAMYLNIGEGKPVLRTKPVDDGKVWTSVSVAVEQVWILSERHNHYKDGGSTSVILEMSLCATCVILRHSQSLVSPLQLLATDE